jgi:transcriptional regulator of acetoin/glycerol metabolism
MLEDLFNRHANRVLSVTKENGKSLSASSIDRSWVRCINCYGMDPIPKGRQAVFTERNHLQEQQERLGNTLEIARIEMNNLYRRISDSGFIIVLTDSTGLILNSVSAPQFIDGFMHAGLWVGATWSEDREGTNAIGTCLIEKQPLTVHLDEHFRASNIKLTCSAAPIFDPCGKLLAVLDVSSVSSLDSKRGQSLTLALAMMSARLIENCNFLWQFRNAWMLRFHNRPELVGFSGEGIIALDGDGRILAANQSALDQLGYPGCEPLLNQPIVSVFDVCPDHLIGRACSQPNAIRSIHDWRGNQYFAVLRNPVGQSFVKKSVPLTIEPASVPVMNLDGLRGGDPFMANNVRCAQRVMNKDIGILLAGETGTGKEAFAKAIHEASERASQPFVAVNCASIPENLIESELFGYKRGAFTGARREGRRGKVLQASGGTLFLDEIGDMPLQLQTRLLRVLEEREVLPLGSETPIPVDLHLISATHHDLQERVATGEFREDLYYRLNGLSLVLPPLRERADRPLLIRSLLAGESDDTNVRLDEETFAALNAYPWPGNIRQLRNVLRTAVALCDNGIIELTDLPAEIAQLSPATPVHQTPASNKGASQDDKSTLACAEREALFGVLGKHHWNITAAATHLAISRNTLYRKMKKHSIVSPNL